MPSTLETVRYSPGEEIANSITHGVGLLLSIAGLVVLAVCASLFGNAWHLASCTIFGSSLVLLYAASTLYHSIQQPQTKRILRILDHSAIFLLIAGTYTPFVLVSLRGAWGWALFGVVWGLAALGILFQTTLLRQWALVSALLYIGMGWVVVVAAKPLLNAIDAGGLLLLLGGGIAYTSGVGFYLRRSLRYHHAIWHVFVLVGSALHFFAVLYYVIPPAP
ncbi:MAG TPA: hemolysin III family protein [Desulfuromonadales bacterium]|nr:hemolysin III family protein [Desulfuromonadales bacterium]